MTQTEQTIWLTQDAYDQLQAELEDLKGPQRQEIVARISAARDEGDLKENGGYHAAKDEQGRIEGRIRQLEDMLRKAEVGETPPDDLHLGKLGHGPTSPEVRSRRVAQTANAKPPRRPAVRLLSWSGPVRCPVPRQRPSPSR